MELPHAACGARGVVVSHPLMAVLQQWVPDACYRFMRPQTTECFLSRSLARLCSNEAVLGHLLGLLPRELLPLSRAWRQCILARWNRRRCASLLRNLDEPA